MPVVSTLYLLCRVWWVLSGIKAEEAMVDKERVEGETEKNVEIAVTESNGGKHMERYQASK